MSSPGVKGDLGRPRASQCSAAQRQRGSAGVRSLVPPAPGSACVTVYSSLCPVHYRSSFLLPCSDEGVHRDARTPRKVRVVRASDRAPILSNSWRERRQAARMLYPAVWSSAMILAPGARGPGPHSRNSPAFLTARRHELATMWVWEWRSSGRGGLVVREMPGGWSTLLGDLR